MKRIKLSFLIAAHNEEKVIEKTLNNLLNLPYNPYEVIIGLDGCTDNTEEIVKSFCKRSKKFKYYKLNLRRGKPEVIHKIIEHASGEVVIINDADWLFKVESEKSLINFLSVFENPEVGGIAESFPVEWDKDKLNKVNIGYKMVAYSSYFWLEFQKRSFTEGGRELKFLKEPTMFLTDIFRKKLYEKNFSLGDDFERTHYIMKKGYKIAIFDDETAPKMLATYDKIFLKDIFKQKIRTAIARDQIKAEQKINISNYYLPAIWHIIKRSWREGILVGGIILFWVILTSAATFIAKFKRMDTKEGWKLRAQR